MTKKQMMERMQEEIFFSMDSWNTFSQIKSDESNDDETRIAASHLARDYHTEAMKLNKLYKEFFNIDAIEEWLNL